MAREEHIKKHFLNIQLNDETMDVYVPRTALLNAVKECMHVLKGTMLDVGCGQMPYREMMLEANKSIDRYIGLDLALSDIHNTSIADLHWDGKHIPLDDNSVDSAMATEVLEHSFSPTETLQEINRVLKPKGTFFFTVPFLWPLHETPYDAYRYTPFSLQHHLEAAGFDQIKISSLGGWHAGMAQMLGLWVKESNLSSFKKKLYTKLFRKLIPSLLKNDVKDNQFKQHCMITGLYGTSVKK